MEENKLKKMIVLKNLPSNLVDEAIVILKPNKKIKSLEKIEEKQIKHCSTNSKKENNYIISEAEMLISEYISKIENKKQIEIITNKNKSKKYKRLKKYAYISSCIIFLQAIMIFIK